MAFSNWFSSPFLRRWILLLWVKIINHGTNKLNTIIDREAGGKPKKGGSKRSRIGNEHEAIIEARET